MCEPSEDVQMELEMLTYMGYVGEDCTVSSYASSSGVTSTSVTVHLRPDTEGCVDKMFVEAFLCLELPESYPYRGAVQCRLQRTRGLDASVVNSLENELAALSSDLASDQTPSIIQLVERTRELLTENNVAGICCICLEKLNISETFRPTGCFHSMHHDCVADWWRRCIIRSYTKKNFDFTLESRVQLSLSKLKEEKKKLNSAGKRVKSLEKKHEILKTKLAANMALKGILTKVEYIERHNYETEISKFSVVLANERKELKLIRSQHKDLLWKTNKLQNELNASMDTVIKLNNGKIEDSVPCPVCAIPITYNNVSSFLACSIDRVVAKTLSSKLSTPEQYLGLDVLNNVSCSTTHNLNKRKEQKWDNEVIKITNEIQKQQKQLRKQQLKTRQINSIKNIKLCNRLDNEINTETLTKKDKTYSETKQDTKPKVTRKKKKKNQRKKFNRTKTNDSAKTNVFQKKTTVNCVISQSVQTRDDLNTEKGRDDLNTEKGRDDLNTEKGWNCPSCTFYNQQNFLTCEICYTNKH